ncbi:HsdM family class I SAM-dependent methyltransferase [Sphingomonas sp.]|jgi:hypothetical protein|uniref:HsdM family class I SAM-dependent methyltransferase n=1 Tax=Sphingomonas sp. TaxID=28214 RepID=UPI002E376A61|nr:N-6 DNA methylase [Sphingomonas sp.]HEX4693169.1 N-6 DNA methylase [Sphingomonas sp.]
MNYLSSWLDHLGYQGSENLISTEHPKNDRPYSAEIEDMLSASRGIGASHVYCVGDVPVVCFFAAAVKPEFHSLKTWADHIRAKVWNQGLASVVIIFQEDELLAFSTLRTNDQELRLGLSEATPTGPWSAYDFSSSAVQQRLPEWFNPELRIDQRLLMNLSKVVSQIQQHGLSREEAEALMAQVIFILYLESRGIVGDCYRAKHHLTSFSTLVTEGDGAGLDTLIRTLAKTFNGDFLNDHGNGPPLWRDVNKRVFADVKRFLLGDDLLSGQFSFWGYDFSIIPVELLSSIYESFLADRQRDQGAYYTPRHLATMAVEEAFARPSIPRKFRVFDGACGSGILLTTAFQKMLAIAEADAGRKLSFAERVDILVHRIFGADVDPTACWITAFSLYLCLLDRLTPSDVAVLQEDKDVTLPPLVSAKIGHGNIMAGKAGDFFGKEPKDKFDILISNPPWKEQRGSVAPFEKLIVDKYHGASIPDRQIAAAYAYVATRRVKVGGTIALVLPLNLLIGLESYRFRQALLELVSIDRIINFADLRHLLFPKAKNACALIIAHPRKKANGRIIAPAEMIEYLSPKADPRLALGAVTITQNDRSLVSPLEVYNHPSVFIQNYWGREEDTALLSRIERFGTVGSAVAQRQWSSAKGFHKTDNNNHAIPLDRPDMRWLAELPFLATRQMPIDHPLLDQDAIMPLVREKFKEVATPGGCKGALFDGPRVIWRNGLSRGLQVRAFYSDRPFAFQHTACCVGGPKEDAEVLQFLSIYLRSELATYFIILSSFSAIADRQAVSKTEVLNLPFILPAHHPNPKLANDVISEVAELFQRLAAIPDWLRKLEYEGCSDWLEQRVLAYFGVTADEADLVRQTARIVAPSLQPTSYKGLSTPLNQRPSVEFMSSYLSTLTDTLKNWQIARGGRGSFKAENLFYDEDRRLGAVHLWVGDRPAAKTESLKNLDLYRKGAGQTGHILEVPDIILAEGRSIYLIKPMQNRYWGVRAALADSERILAGLDAASHSRF